MAFIAWDDSYNTAVDFFDAEHKAMFAITNELYEAVAADAEQARLERIADRLIETVVMHFRHEEMYFDAWQYPDRIEHTAQHRQLRRMLFAYREQMLARPGPERIDELFDGLKDWLTRHIVTQDIKYGAFLLERGLK